MFYSKIEVIETFHKNSHPRNESNLREKIIHKKHIKRRKKTQPYRPGLRSRNRKEPGVFGHLEPEPLEKTQEPEPLKICGTSTGSQKTKSIRKYNICYSSLGKIVSFNGYKHNYFTCFIFLQFYMQFVGKKLFCQTYTIVKCRSRKELHFFVLLQPEPLEKFPGAGAGAGAALEKNQKPEPQPLGKKVRKRCR